MLDNEPSVPVEGSPSEKSAMNGGHNRIPVLLAVVWVAFFVWMVAYVVLYLVPSLP